MTPDACAKAYRKAIAALELAEKRHSENIDLLDQAATAKKAAEVFRLRPSVRDSESALGEKLDSACAAHSAYWRARLEVLQADAVRAAFILRTYDAVARLAGHPMGEAHKSILLGVAAIAPDQVVNDDAIPHEQPDSQLLEDYRGNWR